MKTEPWLRGIIPGVHAVTAHLLRAIQQIREEIAETLTPLSQEQLWATPHGITSAGFHAKHLAGSTRRLCTYLDGRQLSAGQLMEIAQESAGAETPAELIAAVEEALAHYESLIQKLAPEDFGSVREIGRKRLKATAVSLAIHIAEHGHRHVGQAISAAKSALALPSVKI